MPDTVDLGALVAPGGFYLVRSDGGGASPFTEEPQSGPYVHRFTYRGSAPSIKNAAIELIRSARHKIFLASFRIGDRELLHALFDAVDRLRGGVYVITSWTEQTLRRDLESLEDDRGLDEQAQKKQFDALTRRGISLRGHEGCHAKFLIVDDHVALVSSANLETSALQGTSRKRATGESGVTIADSVEVERLARFFTRLWYEGCTWEALPGAEYALHRREPTPNPVSVTPRHAGPGVIWTYRTGTVHELGIRDALHEIIGLARHELLLATFSLVGIRDRPDLLLDPLRRAITEHGVDVRLLVRARNNIAPHREDTAALANLGVRIHGDSDTHAKGVIADARYGALFSANFDAQHGVFSDVEVGVRLDGLPALTEAHRYLTHAMNHADLEFAVRPTQRELAARLGARWRDPWPYGDRLEVSASDQDWSSLTRAAVTGPALWEKVRDELRLHIGDVTATTSVTSGTRRLAVTVGAVNAAARLERWYGERDKPAPGPTRGVCPAELIRADG